jgi:cobalt/nickel transport system permease protein
VSAERVVEKSVRGFLAVLEDALESEDLARKPGLLQRLDPRAKLAGLLLLIVAASAARRIALVAALFGVALALAAASRIPMRTLAARVWAATLLFSALIALPAVFLTPGRVIARVPYVDWSATHQGLVSAATLIARVETTATLALLLVLSTPWANILKALRVFRAPVALIVILGMTYRYVFLLLAAAREMLESRRSRLVGELPGAERRRLLVAATGTLLARSLQLSGDVYLAMRSRGFRGEVYVLDDFRMRARDWLALAAFSAVGGAALWGGR